MIVVDNGSSDGSASWRYEFPDVQWIRLPKNFGLTKAWNLGWRAADAEYVLFLHADTEVEPGAIARLADTLDAHADAVAVCPLLVDAAGQPAPQLGSLPPDGKWRPAQPTGDEPVAGGVPPRRGNHVPRLLHQGDTPDRRALRAVRRRCRAGDADPQASRKILLVPRRASGTRAAERTFAGTRGLPAGPRRVSRQIPGVRRGNPGADGARFSGRSWASASGS